MAQWLEAQLLREVVEQWEFINRELFGGVMRPPIFELADSTDLLGVWRPADRTIALARAGIATRPWAETIEILKHEIAHQFVDEILGGDATPHGPKFREVCEARGIDARATGVGPGDADAVEDSARMRVVARVQKLLALAESSNQHEAELAASTAQRIMLKYNLDLQGSEAGDSGGCAYLWLGEPTGRIQPHQRVLAGLLLTHFFVQVIWIPVYRPLEGKHGSVIEVCGRPENLAMAEYVHAFVLRTIERLWREHKRATDVRSDRDRRSFLAGAVAGLSEKLRAQRAVAQREGLVWVGDARVCDYFRRRHPHTRSAGRRTRANAAAYSKGKSAGQTIVLSRPVNGGSTSGSPRALTEGK